LNPIAFSRPYFGAEEERAALSTLRSGWIVGGARLAEFEEQFAARCGARHAVGTSSWTTGAFLVLKAWGIGPGDEVIVPSLTFIASVNIIAHAGATPVFAEIDPRTWNIDPADVVKKIGPRTRAIIAIDQLGLPCEIDSIHEVARRHGLLVLQDAACAIGSEYRGKPVGSLSQVSVFSLHARKVLTTAEGGMIVTNDEPLRNRMRLLRQQGMSLSDFARHAGPPTTFETYPEIGYNFRITDIQAAIGLSQMARLNEMLRLRRRVAERYIEGLARHPFIALPFVPGHVQPNWQSFQVRVRAGSALTRNAVMERLHGRGIPVRRGVMASHREAPYREPSVHLPNTVAAADNCLQLPMHPGLEDDQVGHILASLDDLARNH
jgi:perosamine synthetase